MGGERSRARRVVTSVDDRLTLPLLGQLFNGFCLYIQGLNLYSSGDANY